MYVVRCTEKLRITTEQVDSKVRFTVNFLDSLKVTYGECFVESGHYHFLSKILDVSEMLGYTYI